MIARSEILDFASHAIFKNCLERAKFVVIYVLNGCVHICAEMNHEWYYISIILPIPNSLAFYF